MQKKKNNNNKIKKNVIKESIILKKYLHNIFRYKQYCDY